MMEVMETSEELDDAKTQDEVDRIRKRNRSKAPGAMKNGDFPWLFVDMLVITRWYQGYISRYISI